MKRFSLILFLLLVSHLSPLAPLFAQQAETRAVGPETVWIKNGDRNLYGLVSRPPYAGKKQPVVIVAHGFNGTHHSGKAYFKPLNQLGYQVYAFDFACGSVHSISDKNTVNMSIRDEESDLMAVIRHFRQRPDVDARRIVVLGESQGGLVSALAAAEHPKEIERLILIYPALCIPDNWNERYPNLEDVPEITTLWDVPLGRRFFREIRELPEVKYIAKYKRPVLIVHGDADPVVPVDYSRMAQKRYKDARLHVISGAGHGFRPDEFEEAIGQILQFLK